VIAAVVLAAGAATRFGSPKQALTLPSVLAVLAEAPVDDVVVVAGAYPVEAERVRVVRCVEWARGPGASLRCGLRALPDDAEAAIIVLADGPWLAAGSVERVLAAWRETGEIAAASYDGERGHPVVLGRDAWDAIPDEGARSLPARLVPCDDLGSPGDVDTPADLASR
jgi:CTP:molybdopterin cytidylyltransferase MocA